MNEEVIEVSEEIIPETAYTPIDYTEYLNKIIENQNSSFEYFRDENEHMFDNLVERLDYLEVQNKLLIEQQSALYELVGNIFILLTAFSVAVVIHKLLSVINGA